MKQKLGEAVAFAGTPVTWGASGAGACTYSGAGQVSLDAHGSLFLKQAGGNVVSIGAGGTAVEDDAISVTGSASVSIAAGTEFTLLHGAPDAKS